LPVQEGGDINIMRPFVPPSGRVRVLVLAH